MNGRQQTTMGLLGLALLVALTATGCAGEAGAQDPADDATIGSVKEAIVDGTADDSDTAAVALLLQGQAFCTGVLISPTVVLTAAHCVLPTPPDHIYFGSKVGGASGTTIAVSHARANPTFDEDTLENDIAVVSLTQTAPVTPAKLRAKTFGQSMVGRSIRVVGFGLTSANASADALRRRSGTTTIDSFTDTDFHFKPNPAQTCSGDSGGPAFETDADGNDVVIGIASSGDIDCLQYGRNIRVDAYAEFIADNEAAYRLPTADGVETSAGCAISTTPASRGGSAVALLGAVALLALRRRRSSSASPLLD